MSKIMEADVWKSILRQQLAEFLADEVWDVGPAICPLEYVGAFVISLSEQAAVLLLLISYALKHGEHWRHERQCTPAWRIFGFVLFGDCFVLHHRTSHCESFRLKVYTVPLQAQKFTAAQPLHRCEINHRVERFIPDCCKQLYDLFFIVIRQFTSLLLGKDKAIAWIVANEFITQG